jgi:hypothetical protein
MTNVTSMSSFPRWLRRLLGTESEADRRAGSDRRSGSERRGERAEAPPA